jgi:hypothetical protein
MQFTTALISLVAALGVSAAPAIIPPVNLDPTIHIVDVGKDGLTYTPPFITANVGDLVQMRFFAKNHTLVQSSFQDPCTPLAGGGIFAGFHPSNITADSTGLVTFETATFPVETTSPLWFYCAQADHCQSGMTFAINPPPGTVATFDQVAATKQQNIAPPGGPTGVVLEELPVFLG